MIFPEISSITMEKQMGTWQHCNCQAPMNHECDRQQVSRTTFGRMWPVQRHHDENSVETPNRLPLFATHSPSRQLSKILSKEPRMSCLHPAWFNSYPMTEPKI